MICNFLVSTGTNIEYLMLCNISPLIIEIRLKRVSFYCATLHIFTSQESRQRYKNEERVRSVHKLRGLVILLSRDVIASLVKIMISVDYEEDSDV